MVKDKEPNSAIDGEELKQFKLKYAKILDELDVLHRGVYDPTDAEQTAALCLLAQALLIRVQASAEFRARSLKRDIDFVKAEAYARIREQHTGKKITETAIVQLVNKDAEVHNAYHEQNRAEREAKELTNILALLKDAHITFRTFAKKEN